MTYRSALVAALAAAALSACLPRALPAGTEPGGGEAGAPGAGGRVAGATVEGGPKAAVAGEARSDAISPLRGRIESISRRVAAQTTDIASGATVALIDPATGRTVATTVSATDGTFDVRFPASFIPDTAKAYFLEAVKGLPVGAKPNRAGAAIARVRTLVAYQGTWTSLTGTGIVIGRASTAVAIVAGYRTLAPAELVSLGGRLSGTTFDAQGTALAQAEVDRVFALVSDAILEDQDPVEAVSFDPGGATAALRFGRRVGGVVIHEGVSPPVPARNATFTVTGQNLPGPGPATPSLRIGPVQVASWSVNAARTRLSVQVPPDAQSGYLEITQGPSTWTGPVVPVAGTTGTLAGGTGKGWIDGPGRLAKFDSPHGIAFDPAGNLYVTEFSHHRIRKISPQGVVTTLAGDGTAGTGDGTGLGARFNQPRHLCTDAAGNVYVADHSNNRVRKITPGGAVSTLTTAGTFAANPGNPYVFPGVVTSVALDPGGNLYVSDYYGQRIWKMTPAGNVSAFVGDGTSGYSDGTGTGARLSYPDGMIWGADGNLYSANNGANHMKKISPAGATSTLTTSGNFAVNGGPVEIYAVVWVAQDPGGTVYSTYLGYVHKIVPGTGRVVIAGASGANGYVDGDNAGARFGDWPYGGAVDANGVLYVTDNGNGAIRVVAP
ncbi:MAG: hypothetical protein FJZ01_13555 [Candidatus Sericytochromatia bacterium]|nr:hypothetical protein [Candidatus Tanganyikabacteria bacterium]